MVESTQSSAKENNTHNSVELNELISLREGINLEFEDAYKLIRYSVGDEEIKKKK